MSVEFEAFRGYDDVQWFRCTVCNERSPHGDWLVNHACPTEGSDVVNSPAHYTVGGIETIDFIEAKGLGYHLGNVIKYVVRCDHKGKPLEDLAKAKWYIERAIELRSKSS